MLSLKLFIKVLPYVWPFIRGMFLGKKTWLEAMRDNKKKVFFMFACLFSFCLNFVLVPRASHLALEYIALEKKYTELTIKYDGLVSSTKHPMANSTEVKLPVRPPVKPDTSTEPADPPEVAKVPVKGKRNKAASQDSKAEDIRAAFEKMRRDSE